MEKLILKIADDAVIGLINPLKAYIELKRIEKALRLALESVNESALSEAKKYGQKSFDQFGANIELRANAGKWNYDHIPHWTKIKEQLKSIEENSKLAFKQQQKGQTMVDADGVIIAPAQYAEGKDNLFIKLKDA